MMHSQESKHNKWIVCKRAAVFMIVLCISELCSCSSLSRRQVGLYREAEGELANLALSARKGDAAAGYVASKMFAAKGNKEEARSYLLLASSNGSTNALFEYSELLMAEGNNGEAWHWLKFLERLGDSRATKLLSLIEPIDGQKHMAPSPNPQEAGEQEDGTHPSP